MSKREFEHSMHTKARRKDAWAYWSDMRNHAKLEAGVVSIELDGPFATGTTGRTITADDTQELELTNAKRFDVLARVRMKHGPLQRC